MAMAADATISSGHNSKYSSNSSSLAEAVAAVAGSDLRRRRMVTLPCVPCSVRVSALHLLWALPLGAAAAAAMASRSTRAATAMAAAASALPACRHCMLLYCMSVMSVRLPWSARCGATCVEQLVKPRCVLRAVVPHPPSGGTAAAGPGAFPHALPEWRWTPRRQRRQQPRSSLPLPRRDGSTSAPVRVTLSHSSSSSSSSS